MTRILPGGGGGPGDWWMLGLDTDPVPQEADGLRAMADRYHRFADDVAHSASGARSLLADPVVTGWLGKSGAAFKTAADPFPAILDSAETAYREVGDAFATLAAQVDTARRQADVLLQATQSDCYAIEADSGLSDDALRVLLSVDSQSALTQNLDDYASSSTLPAGVYKANYSKVIASWQAIEQRLHQITDLMDTLSVARQSWTSAVEDGTNRARKISAGFGATGQRSLDFNERYHAAGGDLADLAAAEGPGSDPAAVEDALAFFRQHHGDVKVETIYNRGQRSHDLPVGLSLVLDRLQQLTPDEWDAMIAAMTPQDLAALNDALSREPDRRWRLATAIYGGVSAATLPIVQSALPALQPGIKDTAHYTDFPDVPLFADGQEGISGNPTDTALNQGRGDDCWFLASVASISLRNPNFFQSRVVENPNGTYSVTFYDGDGKPFTVSVDGQLPITTDDKGIDSFVYAFPGQNSAGGLSSKWVPIIEKAYASFVGSYGATTAGRDSTGLHTLTGQHISSDLANAGSIDQLQDLLDQGRAINTTTLPRPVMNMHWLNGVSTAHLVGTHVYSVEGIDRTTHPPTIVLLNPWGAQGSHSDHPYETRITEDQWRNDFFTYSYTTEQP